MKITVDQGQIHVNSVSVLQMTDTAIALFIDTEQKYPEYWGSGAGDEDYCIMLAVGEHTLNVDANNSNPTKVSISGLEGKWSLVCEVGRYDATIHLIKYVEDNRFDHLQWVDEE